MSSFLELPLKLGVEVGTIVGTLLCAILGVAVGLRLGFVVGLKLGRAIGAYVGDLVGITVGAAVGFKLGLAVGLAVGLKLGETVGFNVEGYCDKMGDAEYNIALGDRRAFATKKELEKNGVPSDKLETISYGKERPAVMGDTPHDLALNRRTVTIAVKN